MRVLAILGMSMLPALAPSLAGARVVTSYYSDQIIITTDETWGARSIRRRRSVPLLPAAGIRRERAIR